MYHEGEAVALPEKGSRVLQRSKRCTYVYYFTERRYDAERGRTVDDRVAVGKLCPDKEGLEESRKETIVAIARNVMNKFGISATEALEAIGVPQGDYAKYLALL